MEREEKLIEIKRLQNEANSSKHKLMMLADELESIGAIRKAKSLGNIIGLLENWQNKL